MPKYINVIVYFNLKCVRGYPVLTFFLFKTNNVRKSVDGYLPILLCMYMGGYHGVSVTDHHLHFAISAYTKFDRINAPLFKHPEVVKWTKPSLFARFVTK